MSFVRIEQRNARLAAAVKLDQIKGREGFITKGTVVVLSNVRKGEGREAEVTSILWTLWGKQADNAAEYLGKGSHVNVVGRLTNNNYEPADGDKVYGFTFTCEEDRLPRQQVRVRDAKGSARLIGSWRGARAPRLFSPSRSWTSMNTSPPALSLDDLADKRIAACVAACEDIDTETLLLRRALRASPMM